MHADHHHSSFKGVGPQCALGALVGWAAEALVGCRCGDANDSQTHASPSAAPRRPPPMAHDSPPLLNLPCHAPVLL